MKAKEIVYICLDLAKVGASDDSYLTEDHTLFLCKKYRAFLIRKEQEKEKTTGDIASEFEYQQICLDLEKTDADICVSSSKLRSTKPIPKILDGNKPRVHFSDYFTDDMLTFVSRDKMKHVGSNPYMKNLIYASIGPDLHLYLTSSNTQFLYLKNIRMSAIFEDFDNASDYLCDDDGESTACDVLEASFPIREYLVPTLIELVVKELSGSAYRPADEKNNANDDTPNLVNRRTE
jgi:hypothetical protein